MGATKSDEYTKAQNDMALLLKAMAHPARVAIVEYLLKVESCICGDIVQELPLAQPTVSQHLRELKQAGIIRGTVEGTSVCYCLDDAAIQSLHKYFGQLASRLSSRKLNCC